MGKRNSLIETLPFFQSREEKCARLKIKVRNEYKKINSMHCTALNREIFFNAQGLFHFRYHVTGQERLLEEQIYKLTLFPLVIPTLQKAQSISDYRKGIFPINSKGTKKEVQYWTVSAIVGKQDVNVSVTIRQIGNGKTTFWSVKKSKKRNQKHRPE